MQKKITTFIRALAVELGTIIGAGVLGLPYVAAHAGWGIGMLYLICLSVLVTGLHLMIGEVAVRTREPLQLVGLAGKYMGRVGKIIMGVSLFLGSFGVLLVYIIGEGAVLKALFGGTEMMWSIIFWFFCSVILFFGLKLVSHIDVFLSMGVVLVIVCIAVLGARFVHVENLRSMNVAYLFLPYGSFLFALMGASAIPQVEEIVASRQVAFKRVIMTAGIIVAIVYALFVTVTVGVTGIGTTEVATVGLGNALGGTVVVLGNVFALCAMLGGFLNIGIATKRVFTRDYRMGRTSAWAITCVTPLVLFIFAARDFIKTLSMVGAVFGTINTILFIIMYWRAREKGDMPARSFQLHHALLLSTAVLAAFLAGTFLTFFR
ncbi:MAG: Amino acid permease [Candidatus Magasanikbacteria bacterium GW2011_GWA2_45_39]|uniref:Amino acid permease n=2 Tax=Candidatus Magasanikiibacteriota TaxID=1752731 RepID=A0A0G1Q579_9BACT|nr:MAG: Amino acid permease [Candidatus Magasanikbacteria bacterium GW2011_GWA2_45_39]KKU12888.1 MAG: Amino acid permease [Candidatus Magasanikbacteria bacterium GW2011_GWC2_45_8]HBW74421.1 hypothetical protein [Candidatus Magasanikbacteria bacterium]